MKQQSFLQPSRSSNETNLASRFKEDKERKREKKRIWKKHSYSVPAVLLPVGSAKMSEEWKWGRQLEWVSHDNTNKMSFCQRKLFLLSCNFWCCLVAKLCQTLWPHGLQPIRLLSPSLSTEVCSNSCSLSQWCYPTISSSVTPFSSYPQSCPASGSFLVSWLFALGGQGIGVLASASVP